MEATLARYSIYRLKILTSLGTEALLAIWDAVGYLDRTSDTLEKG